MLPVISKRIKGIVLDGSGTLVDPGVYAPAVVFKEIFKNKGINISMEEARKPMGNHKKVHIQKILEDKNVAHRWYTKFGFNPNPKDVDELFEQFKPLQLQVLEKYGTPIPCAFDVCKTLIDKDIKLGFSTGFTREMVDTILTLNPELNDILHTTIAADEVTIARPAPFMVYKNMMNMEIMDPDSIIKVDDTEMGVKEGDYAGCWSVGITKYSNLMSMTEDEVEEFILMEPEEYIRKTKEISHKFYDSGAHFVIETIQELPLIVDYINYNLHHGMFPRQGGSRHFKNYNIL